MSATATLEPTERVGTPALHLQGLVKRFGGVAAVDGIDLELAAGEPLAVIGPNGAGKSTLLRLIAGELKPDEGKVLLSGREHAGAQAHQIARRGVGLAHQVPLPFGRLTVRENVRVGGLSRRHGHEEYSVDAILARCGIERLAHRTAGSLGLLDLKRLELARALSLRPQILLLDEVAAGLAGPDLDAIIGLVSGIRDDGMPLVIVEHVERVVRELVERVVVLDWGRVIAQGSPREVAADATVKEVYLGSGHEPRAAGKRRANAPGPLAGRDTGLALNLSGVSAGYGSVTALRDLDLEVGPGETVAVLGANGAGKSTLARVISGLAPVRTGAVRVDGMEVTGLPAHRRVEFGIAHCQEGRRLFAGMTVQENLLLPTHGSDRARQGIDERLAWVESLFPILAERRSQEATSLSGGQQQMVAIARALMSAPRLVVFDEISLGLAPGAIDVLYTAVDAIADAGVSILLVEQNVHRGLASADRAYVLDRGEVTFSGDPQELMDEERLNAAYFGADEAALGSSATGDPR